MVEVFTRSIVREIGRNVGKVASNKLLGDSHSTPYRRVSGVKSANVRRGNIRSAVLGASSGGYKYENQLDRLIKTFQIKGKLATFNSAQNIYNEYFKLVEEATSDENIDNIEALYLVEQFHRTAKILMTITKALKELDAKDKAQLVEEKLINLNEFIKSLNESFELVSTKMKVIDKKPLKISIKGYLIAILLTVFLITIWVSEELYLKNWIKHLIGWTTILIYIISWTFKLIYKKGKKNVLEYNNRMHLTEKTKKVISIASNIIEKAVKTETDLSNKSTESIKNIDPLNINYYKKRDS